MLKHKFDILVPRNAYIRWAHDPDEISLARRGKLRDSKNHRSGKDEPGLSVSEGPWIYWGTHKYAYFVTGRVVGRGSDGEPTLDPSSVKVVGDLFNSEEMIAEFCSRNGGAIQSLANQNDISEQHLTHFLLGAYHIDAPRYFEIALAAA